MLLGCVFIYKVLTSSSVFLQVFSGYILFDTQIIVEKAAAGEKDHIQHAGAKFFSMLLNGWGL